MSFRLIKNMTLLTGFIVSGVTANPLQDIRANLEDARNSFIFVMSPGASVEVGSQAAQQAGGTVRHVFRNTITGFSATLPEEAARRLVQNHPTITSFEPNRVVWAIAKPDRPKGKPPQDGEGGSNQVTPWGVNRIGGSRDGMGKNAWVIDTGIDASHRDLTVGPGANFVTKGKNTTHDENGHGTHVAGTIAALDNNHDVVGVAAGATVHPIRVLDRSGSGILDSVIAGIDYVAANATPGDCANMSLGARGFSQALQDAVVNAASRGIWFAVAAGNDGEHADNFTPAQVEHPYVLTVSAINSDDQFAAFSNFGNPPVDWAAPGVAIESTRSGGGTATYSGTSMATPHVCGIVMMQGAVNTDGYAIGDPDGSPDPIAHY
ncbi:hypothetical protein GCM10023116_30540 [Kistimonas scapharcae]|uniref:Peptidase S8/S53 domain-containing protein n=1 Tax=Kistimonas scapharcae TaxID=1036133 RepID=A0ABP8V4B2_9GAMM